MSGNVRLDQDRLNEAVRKAYGMSPKANTLEFLFDLNQELAQKEASPQQLVGPGLPPIVKDAAEFITDDCIVVATAEGSRRGRSAK